MSDGATLGRHALVRSHGLGNDYLIVDGERFGIALTPDAIRAICHRNTGVGSDGILVRSPPPAGFDAAVRILNPDGSEAEKSGNGVRIFAKFCFDDGYADRARPLRIHTLGGPVTAHWLRDEAGRTHLRVSMGRASFRCADLPMTGADEWIQRPLSVGDRSLTATCVSVGNPHTVVFDAPFEEALVKHYGPLIENHAQFPQRTNVQFVRVRDRRTVEAMIWERGAGWTLSSGSSSCAVAAACVKAGLVDREVAVVMPGGTLAVTVHDDFSLDQVGFAEEVGRVRLADNFLCALERDGAIATAPARSAPTAAAARAAAAAAAAPASQDGEAVIARLVAIHGEGGLSPTAADWRAILRGSSDRPVTILNLLAFKPQVDTPQGSEPGASAYARYGAQVAAAFGRVGGKRLFFGNVEHVFPGAQLAGWQAAIMTRYPSPQALAAFWLDEEFVAAHAQRIDGVERSQVIVLSAISERV